MLAFHVISGRMFGGGQRVVQDLVRTLPRVSGVRVRLCLLGEQDNFFAAFEKTVVPYDGNFHNPCSLLRSARQLRWILRKESPDILHTHGYEAELIGALAVWGLKTRHISHVHDTPIWTSSTRLRHRVRRMLTKLLLRGVGTQWIACSEAVKQHISTHFNLRPGAIYTVCNGIDVETFTPNFSPEDDNTEQRPIILGTAARLANNKGIRYAIEATNALRERGNCVLLRIAGDGPLKGELMGLASSLGVEAYVEFLGLVDDMVNFYRDLDIFVLPSLSEGLPLTILEAMSSGLPVVTTPVMGTAEAVRSGLDGIIVPTKSVTALAEAIEALCTNLPLRRAMGRSARQRVRSRFSIQKAARSIADVYFAVTSVSKSTT